VTDHALTALLYRHVFTIDDHGWAVVEVSKDGRVLMYRQWDAPYYDRPGVAYHRWFDASVLSAHQQRRWDDMDGWGRS
jgi:hypothetical protein